MLNELLAGNTFALVFVFARIGSAIMLLPGFGEAFVAPRARLLIALGIPMVVTPVVIDLVPPTPSGPMQCSSAQESVRKISPPGRFDLPAVRSHARQLVMAFPQ